MTAIFAENFSGGATFSGVQKVKTLPFFWAKLRKNVYF